jgi:ferritin-like metal-binding protein YciE
MKISSLRDLYVDVLKDAYSAENQIVKALPRIAKAVVSPELKNVLEQHLEETRNHVDRLEQIFDKLGVSPKGKRCKGMEGIIEEGAEFLEADGDDSALDAGFIAAAQKVEHYEMATYGCARTYAEMLGDTRAAELLQETLDEEMAADQKLTDVAERVINPDAVSGESTQGGQQQRGSM